MKIKVKYEKEMDALIAELRDRAKLSFSKRSEAESECLMKAAAALTALLAERKKLISDANESNRILGDRCEQLEQELVPREPTEAMLEAGIGLQKDYLPL